MNRNITLDIIKGICIFAIVCNHFEHKILWFGYIFVYSFYFVAGYTFKDKDIKKFAKQKFSRIYLSFVSTCLFTIIALKILSKLSDNYYNININWKMIKNILLFQMPHNIMSPSWFVFPLFIILFFYYALNRIIKNKYLILCVSFGIYSLSYIFINQFNQLFWNNCRWLTNVCIGMFVFSCGQVLASNKKLENILFNGKYSIDLFVLSTVVLYLIYKYTGFKINIRDGVYSSFFYNTIVCTVGMIFIWGLSKLLSASKIFASVFSKMGYSSMAIMNFHILSASVGTLIIHYTCNIAFPDNWTFSYVGGITGLFSIILGICIPLIGSVILKYLKMYIHNLVAKN